MVNNVYLGLGSNLGDKKQNLIESLKKLKDDNNIIFSAVSSLYISKAYGVKEQDDFFNIVLKINTLYSPFGLLNVCQKIEQECGRLKTKKWGPRKIDIDILFYNNLVLNTGFLKIPHIEANIRDFVLVPLCEIDNHFKHPVLNTDISEIEKKIVDRFIIDKIKFNEEEIV